MSKKVDDYIKRDSDAIKVIEEFLEEVRYEMHADGVKEIPCDFCEEACKTDWCPTKDSK